MSAQSWCGCGRKPANTRTATCAAQSTTRTPCATRRNPRWPERGVIPDLGSPRMAPSSPVSRPSPSGGLRPALTRAPGGANGQLSRAGTKEDQQTKIRLPQVSGEHHDAELAYNTLAMGSLPSPYLIKGDVSTLRGKPKRPRRTRKSLIFTHDGQEMIYRDLS